MMVLSKQFYFFTLLFVVFLAPIVSAQFSPTYIGDVVRDGINFAVEFYRPILEALFGGYSGGDFLLAKSLLFILVFILVRVILQSLPVFEKSKAAAVIVALVVAILGIRYLEDNQITQFILTPYSTLGVALSTIIPFLIYFFFIHKTISSGVGRKAAWLFFMIVYIILWVTRLNLNDWANLLYLAVICLSIILFFFDRKIRAYFDMAEIKKDLKDQDVIQYHKELDDLATLKRYLSNRPQDKALQRMIKNKTEHIMKTYGASKSDLDSL